jgi:hypothetical protein
MDIDDKEINLSEEILSIGFTTEDRVLHFGVCDNNLNFIETAEKNNVGLYYLGIDVKDEVDELSEKYKDMPPYAFKKISMQDFIDDELYDYNGNLLFETTLITGIFDKPIYKERQYVFISMMIERCLRFSKKVIFIINNKEYIKYNYSILYVINNFLSAYNNVIIKKLDRNNYIFCVTI